MGANLCGCTDSSNNIKQEESNTNINVNYNNINIFKLENSQER
jgi:hypothetical protein